MKRVLFFFLPVFFLFNFALAYAQTVNQTPSSSTLSQPRSISSEAVKQLEQNPSFQGLTPQEVQEGLKLLKRRQTSTESPTATSTTTTTAPSTTEGSGTTAGIQSSNKANSQQPKSLFSSYLKKNSGELTVSINNLKPFGYNIFKKAPSQPLFIQPVPPNYIIGPGDEIQVLLWGRINAQYTLKVGADGRIFFPNIGPLMVSGMTYSKMQKFLTDQAKRIIGTNVSVTLYKLHQIQVFVLGEVKNPGLYDLPAMSTMLNALIAAGGPTMRGTLRRIELKRHGRTVDVLDLYRLLLRGDDSHDKILRNNDIVFVPLIGPLVGVAGNVKRPGIYELKNEKNLYDVIQLAGGLLPSAWKQMIQVDRFNNHKWKVVLDVSFNNPKIIKKFRIHDGDLVKVFPVPPLVVNAITLNGNVVRPGTYAYHPGMKLSDIIKSPDDLLPDTYLKYGLIKRYDFSTLTTKIIPFNVEKVLKKEKNIYLKPLDSIYIFPKSFFVSEPVYYIYGEVRNPGEYSTWDNNFRLRDLIMKAGGLKKDAYLKRAEIVSFKVTDKGSLAKVSDKFVNLYLAMKGNPKYNILLHPYDEVFVRKIPGWGDTITVDISGEVKFPGTYTLKRGATLSDLIRRAGGYKNDAYLDGAVLTTPTAKKIQQEALNSLINRLQSEIFISSNAAMSTSVSTQEIQINKVQMLSAEKFINTLKQLKAKGRVVIELAPLRILEGSPYDLKLENGAKLFIPREKDIVSVVGAVMSPSTFIYSKNLTYKDYIKMAGGYASYADQNNVFIIAADGSAYKVSGGFVRWNPFKSRWELSAFSKKNGLEPGDTIVVPAKLRYIPWLRNVKDITQIMMQIAVTTGVVLRLF